ncbi:Phage tail protein [Bordetella tumbae]
MNGIGGCTIAEAKERLSYREFVTWRQYRAKRGGLNLGMRVERAAATIAALYANSHSKNGGYTIYDFMPHESAPAISLEQAMKEWA